MATKDSRNPLSLNDAMNLLVEGNERFIKKNGATHPLQDSARRTATATKQEPWAVVLTCADSRVAPEMIFDSGIGELFVVRVAGNIANVDSIASVEYAVAKLNVKLVIVLGHENCGAVAAALDGKSVSYNIDQLLSHLSPMVDEFQSDYSKASKAKKAQIQNDAAARNAELACDRIREQSTIIWEKEELTILPAIYSTKTGKVEFGPWWPERNEDS